MTRLLVVAAALGLARPSDPGEGIYETSKELGQLVERELSVSQWAERSADGGLKWLTGFVVVLFWAFRRARKEARLRDWHT